MPSLPRRSFLGQSAALAVAASFPAIMRGEPNSKKLKIALVGCGGRGSGAANQALTADSNCELAYLADIAEDQADNALKNLTAKHPEKTKNAQKFIGLDAIDKVCASDADVVLLTTPPGFRPEFFQKVVEAGKHTFCEKPVATDPAGARRFMEAARLSKQKGLGCQSGFCWRSSLGERAIFEQIKGGAIGKVMAVHGTYLGATPWVKPRKPEWTDLEWQLRNWMYFTWLSGDHLVEQCIHTVDKMSWAFGDVDPISAVAVGGRQQRVEPEYGHIYDHFGVTYEYPDGGRGFIYCRQQSGTFSETADHIIGSEGMANIIGSRKLQTITGKNTWRYQGPAPDMYQVEHDEFFASIRQGNPLNFAEKLAHSTMIGIMGRLAAYTGKQVTWEDLQKSQEDLRPKEPLKWDMKLSVPEVAIPGRYPLV
jgi:predicted dehydrogenase